MHFTHLLLIWVQGSFCREQSQYRIRFFSPPPWLVSLQLLGGCLRERAPSGAACCMIISVFSSGKPEQKSLRDREGPHGSPVLLLGPFLEGLQRHAYSAFARWHAYSSEYYSLVSIAAPLSLLTGGKILTFSPRTSVGMNSRHSILKKKEKRNKNSLMQFSIASNVLCFTCVYLFIF